MRSAKELDAVIQGMSAAFDGKESEQNWKQRDNHLLELAKIAEGNAPKDFHHAFVGGIRSLLDGIIASIISERTTLSNHACQFTQVLAKTIGSSIHPMLDYLLPALVKLSASAKPISSRAGNDTMRDILIGAKTYSPRLLHHVAFAFTSETSSPRIYAPGWLETLIKLYGSQIDHSGCAKQVEEAVKRSLNDAHPKARENARPLYWAFAKQWPSRSEPVMALLEPQRQKALQDDPNNPNRPAKADKYTRPASSLAEAKAQAKKSMQVKRSASDQDAPPFLISLDAEKAESKPAQPQADRKKAPIRPRHEPQQQTMSHPNALQPLSNPALSGSTSNRPDTGHGSSHSKTGSADSIKSQESLAAQRARPLMAAPVRRAVRVVSNSTPAPAIRPSSREGQSREPLAQLREAKLPLRPMSADTPVDGHTSRSPVFEENAKVDGHWRTRSKHEPKADLPLGISAPQPTAEPVIRPLEEHRRKPTQSKDVSAAQAAAKLQHALKKIRSFDLAPLGLTKVRRLIESNSDVLFSSKQPFEDVMSTMFFAAENIDKMVAKHLQEQPEDAFASMQQQTRNTRAAASVGDGIARDYRFSIISILQSMLFINSGFFAAYHTQALRLLLLSRGVIEEKDHKVKDLEDMTWSIINRCDHLSLLRTVFEVLDNLNLAIEKSSPLDSSRTIVMGLQALSLLYVTAQENNMDMVDLDPWLEKGAQVAGELSRTANPRVRKACVDLSVVLQKIMGDQAFDEAFSGDEGMRNMVTYYANKANMANAQSRSIPGLVGWGERE